MASMTGCISAGAVAIAACIRVIFSSGLLPWMFPSKAIFLATALIASGYALSFMADSMMGSNSATAVFGSPLRTASSTFFHRSGRGVWAAVVEVTISATPAAKHTRETPRATRRFDRFIARTPLGGRAGRARPLTGGIDVRPAAVDWGPGRALRLCYSVARRVGGRQRGYG